MKKGQPEKVEQASGLKLLGALGGRAYVSGTHRRRGDYQGTMQTPGIPDVEVFLPRRLEDSGTSWVLLKWECKAPGGRLRPEQREYQTFCALADVNHVTGDCNALIAWLIEHHFMRPDSVPHYRLPLSAAVTTEEGERQ